MTLTPDELFYAATKKANGRPNKEEKVIFKNIYKKLKEHERSSRQLIYRYYNSNRYDTLYFTLYRYIENRF
jgi:hypothetical protein